MADLYLGPIKSNLEGDPSKDDKYELRQLKLFNQARVVLPSILASFPSYYYETVTGVILVSSTNSSISCKMSCGEA